MSRREMRVPPSTILCDPPAPAPSLLPQQRCPATTRNTPPLSVITYGVQCKYTVGHHGDPRNVYPWALRKELGEDPL